MCDTASHDDCSIFSRAVFSQLYFWIGMLRGRVLPRKFEKFHTWAKPAPRSNPAIMHRTITDILPKIREIEASSMGVETLRGYNVDRPPCCNPKTRNHKQASIFIELADAKSSITNIYVSGRKIINEYLILTTSWTNLILMVISNY